MATLPRPVRLDKLSGLRNALRPERLPPGSLTQANNVDSDDSGTVERRDGYAQSMALTNCQAAYATVAGDRLFLVEDGALYSCDSDLSKSKLADGITDLTLAWCEAPPMVFYAGTRDAGVILRGLEYRSLRLPSLGTPAVVAVAGNLYPGQYQVTYILVDKTTLQETAAPPAAVIELVESQGLHVNAPILDGYETMIYLSEPNGDRLYYAGTGSGVFTDPTALIDLAHPLHDEQYAMNNLPENVTALAWHEGRLFAATAMPEDAQSVVWFSQPFWPTMYNLAADYFLVDGAVCALASTQAGLLIGTEKALWLYTPDEALQRLTQFGVVPGYPISQDRDGLHYVWTVKGLYSFPPLTPITEGKAYVAPGRVCSTAVVERRGRKQVIALTDGGGDAFNPY